VPSPPAAKITVFTTRTTDCASDAGPYDPSFYFGDSGFDFNDDSVTGDAGPGLVDVEHVPWMISSDDRSLWRYDCGTRQFVRAPEAQGITAVDLSIDVVLGEDGWIYQWTGAGRFVQLTRAPWSDGPLDATSMTRIGGGLNGLFAINLTAARPPIARYILAY